MEATAQVAMITLKLALDKRRAKRDNTYPLVFRINISGLVRDIPTGYSILETDWDEKTHVVKKSFVDYDELAPRIRDQHVKYLGKIIEYERLSNGIINIQELKEFVLSKVCINSVFVRGLSFFREKHKFIYFSFKDAAIISFKTDILISSNRFI